MAKVEEKSKKMSKEEAKQILQEEFQEKHEKYTGKLKAIAQEMKQDGFQLDVSTTLTSRGVFPQISIIRLVQ
ncbi:hypothetical protein KAR91_27155 [Candidatus Pacearchaeota archaeon]|nr:hypothetical protein [Candidatus Pacearchaeota archaeon]